MVKALVCHSIHDCDLRPKALNSHGLMYVDDEAEEVDIDESSCELRTTSISCSGFTSTTNSDDEAQLSRSSLHICILFIIVIFVVR